MKNRFRLLFAVADDQPPAGGSGGGSDAPQTPAVAPETPPEETEKDKEEEEEPPAGEESPTPAEASNKLNAFQRGALRALGVGGLVTKVEELQGQIETRDREIATLKAENTRLSTEVAKKPAEIAAAEAAAEKKLSASVAAELQSLGVPEKEAPSSLSEEQTRKTMKRADFDKLNHQARNTFIRDGGKVED